jgi:choline dehydrogenase-like flavoprotein
VCLLPAVESFGAKVLTECEVLSLEADQTTVRRIRCRWNGRELCVAARVVIVAAGALMTPILLLNSRNEHWPNGLANGSGFVGRNLMVHSGDMIAVRVDPRGSTVGPAKALSLNDLYLRDGRKLGNLQSVGIPVSTGAALAHLRSIVDRSPGWWTKLATPLLLRVAARIGALYFRNAIVFGSIVEDLPYYENRVLPDPAARNGMRFVYRYPRELWERNELFRRRLVEILGSRRVVCLTRENNLNFGHPCGTCRFGDDPATSVLDRNNRAHEVENLYAVDASFFPSSGGTNPSLTIAANALRVAEAIDRQLS